MPASFDLPALIRRVAAEHPSSNLHEVTAKVRAAIPDERVGDALDQALQRMVYATARRPERAVYATSANGTAPATTTTRTGANESAKLAARRSMWRAELREWVTIGDRSSAFLGDCTADNLRYAARMREQLAEANRRSAARMLALADAVDRHNVALVADLPAAVLAQFFAKAGVA